MKPVLTPAEMADADQNTIAAGTPVEVLMERAGRAVAWEVRRLLGGTYGRRALVVCGKGNNGGDGLVTARALREWGMQVHVARLEGGIDRVECAHELARSDVVVDAMYGTGMSGALEGDAAWIAEATAGRRVVAVDIPSGVYGSTGVTYGPAVRATRTVTFAARKPGLLFEPGRSHSGVVTVADIGIETGEPHLGIVEASDVHAWLPQRAVDAHKWNAGLMVVGGSAGMTGAPMFVSRAAMRAGAGIVWCGVPGRDAAARGAGTEVITRALPAGIDGNLDESAALHVLHDISRFRALVVGPGLGRDDRTRDAVCKIVEEAAVPLVLDADGLNALDGDLEPLRARHERIGAPVVLTPHDGEYERLLGVAPGEDRITAARRLADAAHATVLLKGPTTVIADPGPKGSAAAEGDADGVYAAVDYSPAGPARVAINCSGGPMLASAGTGDVLSGIIGGFLARGASVFEAAAAAAWVHGRAAEHAAAASFGTGLVAGDLLATIPHARMDARDA